MDDETRKHKPDKQYQRNVYCPIHNRLIGHYDGRVGVINVTYYCPLCRREYTFTIKKDAN
ncbi:MAG: hypothetical protein NC548_26275 [Lachnospiraceae bacterium]|nr:hypothetical protein [Lachnospiraceae bacterium]